MFNARTRIALLCAVALLLPMISISDDITDPTSQDAAALVMMVVFAIILCAIAHVQSITARAYVVCVATPSDPRSPPR